MKIYTFALLAGIATLPLTSLAATYYYVDTTSEVGSVEANSASQALVASDADRAPHSGVVIDRGFLETGDDVQGEVAGASTGLTLYDYVDVFGKVEDVAAVNAEQALMLAADIHPHSGVVNTEMTDVPEGEVVSVR